METERASRLLREPPLAVQYRSELSFLSLRRTVESIGGLSSSLKPTTTVLGDEEEAIRTSFNNIYSYYKASKF
ncbi:unnamed protein product [Caenorhabditis nigoni]